MKKIVFGFIGAGLLAAAVWLYYEKNHAEPRRQEAAAGISAAAYDFTVKEMLIDPLLITAGRNKRDITCRLPLRYSTDDIRKIFADFTKKNSGTKTDVTEVASENADSVIVSVFYGKKTAFKARFIRNNRPKIAVILDDWGYNTKGIPYLKSIKQPFAAAILPGLPYSSLAAKEAAAGAKAVMLHLPMEPKTKLPLEKNTIKANMSEGEVKYALDTHIAEVRGFTGINNHQGSLATTSHRIMRIVLNEIKERNLFFIDSLTTPDTIGYKLAARMGVKSSKRDIFIDNEKDEKYITGQFEQLKRAAKSRGYAVGLGHDDPVTLRTLAVLMEKAEKEGFEFVYPAEIVF
ncbi:MAG TPA: divergent polysaccharide deacetylase family protein [bacterium]|nr:divergent polysaccharide deacetylase family protein [bacterium]